MVAAILSAQCRDVIVNATTKSKIFPKYKTAKDYADARLTELEKDIAPITFFRAKAANVKGACKILIEEHGGKVPDTMEVLQTLPGIGRKTANAILINGFGKVEGITVDTHVIRVAFRLGLTKFKAPEKIEQDLMVAVPRENWKEFPYLLKDHGRSICRAPIPVCSKCPVSYLCPKKGVTKRL
jgi:endonuclease-3